MSRRIKSLRKSQRKSRKVSRKTQRKSRKVSRKSQRKSISSDDEKIKSYFRRQFKKYDNYVFGNIWKHPLTGKQGKTSNKARRLFDEVKKEVKRGKMCNVERSKTNNRDDLIKELRSYSKCWEKKTGKNQDLSMERLKEEPLRDIKKTFKILQRKQLGINSINSNYREKIKFKIIFILI